jgi:N-acyl-L-homoserine lactone synthetase
MKSKNNISGISAAIQCTMNSLQENNLLLDSSKTKEFTIKIANTLQEREAVFRLGYQIYLEKGFIKSNTQEWLIQQYDFDPETIILIVQDQEKNLVGSVTLVFDGATQLPAEKIYGKEINRLKNPGNKLVELSRLIINPRYRNAKEVLVLLFNYLGIYSFQIKNYTSLIIQVNPRHKNYYKSLLNFDEIGNEKACPMVQNAPAVLLHLPLIKCQSELERCTSNLNQKTKERSLYPYFFKLKQQKLIAYYLARQVKPMSFDEKLYFGFSESKSTMALAL